MLDDEKMIAEAVKVAEAQALQQEGPPMAPIGAHANPQPVPMRHEVSHEGDLVGLVFHSATGVFIAYYGAAGAKRLGAQIINEAQLAEAEGKTSRLQIARSVPAVG